jgi:hypothetical protein
VDTDADLQVCARESADHRRLEGTDDRQAGSNGHLGHPFVPRRVPEVSEQPVAEELGDVPVVLTDDLRADCLVLAENLAQILWVEALGERGGPDDVAEEDR